MLGCREALTFWLLVDNGITSVFRTLHQKFTDLKINHLNIGKHCCSLIHLKEMKSDYHQCFFSVVAPSADKVDDMTIIKAPLSLV